MVTGQVTDSATSSPISGARVWFSAFNMTTTDSSGNYSVTNPFFFGPNIDHTMIFADNYEWDFRLIRETVQNVRLYPIERITAGESWQVTVRPDDSLCVNHLQNPTWGEQQHYVCRSVHILAASDGVMTLEAIATQGGARPPLIEVEIRDGPNCCYESMGNPTSIRVTAGAEFVASVEMVLGSTTSQSSTLKTSMTGQ